MINGGSSGISNFALSETIELHRTHPVFIRRKITTWLVDFLADLSGLEIGISFVLVNFSFLFFSGILVFKLSKLFSPNFSHNIFSLIGYFLSFPILFMFFPPVYSYDEPLQFCLIFLSLIYFFKEAYWKFSFIFGVSLITRESGIIILPALFFVFVYNWKNSLLQNFTNKKVLIKCASFTLSILLYGSYLLYFTRNSKVNEASKEYFLQRLSYIKWNFQNSEFAIESIGGFLLVFAIPIYFYFIRRNKKDITGIKERKMLMAFFITLIINTAIVYLNTKAREVRLFLIPMFFLWPIFGSLFFNEISLFLKFDQYKNVFLNLKRSLIFFLMTLINLYLSFILYHPTAGPKKGVFNLYMFISFTAILIHYMLSVQKNKTKI
jgi:hypothetical protein